MPEVAALGVRPPSLSSIVQRHGPMVRRALRQLGVQADVLDDATQDVFVVLFRRIDDYDPGRRIDSWLWGIAKGVASGYRRGRRRQARLHRALNGAPAASAPTPEQAMARTEAAAVLERFLGSLDEGKCAVFVLSEIEGCTGPEIACRLDLNVNTVYARLRTARQHFERALSRHHGRPRRWAAWLSWAWWGPRPAAVAAGMAMVATLSVSPSPSYDDVQPATVAAAAASVPEVPRPFPQSRAAPPTPPIPGAIHGRALDERARPSRGAWICIEPSSEATRHCGETDDDGWLRVSGLRPGTYRVMAVDAEAQASPATGYVDLDRGSTHQIELMLVDSGVRPRSRQRARSREVGTSEALAVAVEPAPVRAATSPVYMPLLERVVVRPVPRRSSFIEVRTDFVDVLDGVTSEI